MIGYCNKETGEIKINATLIAELPDMDEAYRVVKDHGEKSIEILERHRTAFFDVPPDDTRVKQVQFMYSGELRTVLFRYRGNLEVVRIEKHTNSDVIIRAEAYGNGIDM
jgi:hypothetical protein